MRLSSILKKIMYLSLSTVSLHAMETSPLLSRDSNANRNQKDPEDNAFHFTHNATHDAKLLHAIFNGPDTHDHPFVQAGYIVPSLDERFEAHVQSQDIDPLTMSMVDFANKNISEHPELKILEPHIKVRHLHEDRKDFGTLALICVHGTYSKELGFGDNLDKTSTRSILDFAKKLGVSYNKAVSIISFAWSGELNLDARKHAGSQLAAYLMAHNNYDLLYTIAHSHGCNVVNWAAYQMLEDGYANNIDTAIHLASPVPDIQLAAPDGLSQATPETTFNIKKLFHFYGSNDVTGLLGTMLAGWHTGRKTRAGSESNCESYNIRTQADGYQLDHLNIKQVLAHLPALLHAIETYYTCFFDLDANVSISTDGTLEYPMVAIRKRSEEQQHTAVRTNYRRGLAYSAHQERRYTEKYKASIHDKPSLLWRMVAAPVQEYWHKADHDTYKPPTQNK